MSSRDRDVDDWFRRFTGGRGWFGSGGRGNLIGEFEEMRKEMERMFLKKPYRMLSECQRTW